MEELQALRSKIVAEEGEEMGEAVVQLLAFVIDKLANWNCHFVLMEHTGSNGQVSIRSP